MHVAVSSSEESSSADPARNVFYRTPQVADGAAMWRLAEGSGGPDGQGGLDLNTPYAYLLWCRDFAATSVVATEAPEGPMLGFVMGYLRPDEPDVVFVWQVTTSPEARGRGVARGMLNSLVDRLDREAGWLEASVTPENVASRKTFERFASDRGAPLETSPMFGGDDFPTPHEPEELLRIGPL